MESGVRAIVEFGAVPFLPDAHKLADEGIMPGGSRRNLEAGLEMLTTTHGELEQLLIADAQTSGGLVFGVDSAHTADVIAELEESGHTAARIGTAQAADPGFELV